MGLRNSKQKHSNDKKMENSVKNKIGQKMNKFTEQKPEIGDSAKKHGKQNSDVGFQIEKKKNKSQLKCQINEFGQITYECDTDNEDSAKVKTKETEAPISPKISITDSSSSRSKKRREYDFDIDKWDDEECHHTSGYTDKRDDEEGLERNSLSDDDFEPLMFNQILGRRSTTESDESTDSESSPPDKCRSSDKNEEHISRMDKIIAQGNIPSIPRRNRPAPPPPDLLE